MLKAKLTDGSLIFGLSDENVNRLKQGQPIMFNLKDMGLEDRTIYIIHGKDEDEMYIKLSDGMDLEKTKVNF